MLNPLHNGWLITGTFGITISVVAAILGSILMNPLMIALGLAIGLIAFVLSSVGMQEARHKLESETQR